MNSVSDYLIQLQKLTRQNLDILSAINESFFTKQTHLNVKVGENNYAMPSFIYLENKINNLQANFENLVHAPETGEAFFNFNGNSRAIEVRSFTNTPNSIKMEPINSLSVQQNDIFKDFLTPVPYFRVNLSEIPDDIVSVNIKKVIPKNDELIKRFESILNTDDQTKSDGDKSSINYNYSELFKILSLYKEDEDYIEYDSVKSLPIRKNIGSGTYVIEKIISDDIDENLDEFITLKLRDNLSDPRAINNLAYRLFDETIYKQLNVGDYLITYNNSAKLEIVEIFKNTNTLKLKVLYGEYLNLVEETTETELSKINDMCKLRFFAPIDSTEYKYIDIPLEEDRLLFISVAPLNSRMNIQASWGTGLIINTDNLSVIDNDGHSLKFPQYYEKYVKDVGDILFEITSIFNSRISALTQKEYDNILQAPILNTENLQVVQINKHLNDSPVVQNIRALYSQKKRYNTELTEIQTNIDNINSKLSSISFDDTSGMRSVYTAQLSEYNTKKNELVTSITKIINEISIAANNSEVPIEAAKYHIRGYFDYVEYMKNIGVDNQHVIGVEVQYRYKNVDQPQGTAHTINNKFLYSDWNMMNNFINYKHPDLSDSTLKYSYPENNDTKNEPSINQIDIPISQGETVDIKIRILYDYGYPFIKTVSNWSEIINIAFPKEYLKNIQIVDIISENNNDIETNRFNNIINERGIPTHIEDKIVDQDLTYFHRPENIASGFYTNERRIIPLKDKLSDMDNTIKTIQDEVLGSSAESITVSINNGDVSNILYPFQTNNIGVESYNTFAGSAVATSPDGTYSYDSKTGIVSTILNIVIANKSNHTSKLYSMFPGSRDVSIFNLVNSKYDKSDYAISGAAGVWVNYDKDKDGGIQNVFKLQTANQFVSFRLNNPFDNETYYKGDDLKSNFMPTDYNKYKIVDTGTVIYPKVREEFALCMNNDTTNTYRLLAPGEEIIIPMLFEYKLSESHQEISKTVSIDLRPSLYNDPVNYTFKVTAKLNNTTQDKLITTSRKYIDSVKYNTTVTK